jgi:multicomponent Na+:H+ antiporter subunit C
VTVLVAAVVAVLFAGGTWLLLQRRLSRIIVGVGLMGHGANLLLLTSGGGPGTPPLVGNGDADGFADPLPQALVLTAIVITFGVSMFLLALGYRSWQVTHDDEVDDDVEDRRVAREHEATDVLADAQQAERARAAEEAAS